MKSEYDPGGLHARAAAQQLFLQAIRDCELEPSPHNPGNGRQCHVLRELQGSPLQCFQSLYDCTYHGLSHDLLKWNLFAKKWTEEGAIRCIQVFTQYGRLHGYETPVPNLMNNISPAQFFAWLELRKAVEEWANEWNLASWEGGDPWFFDHTLFTLYLWCADRIARDEMILPPVSSKINSLPIQDLRTTVTLEIEADLAIESRREAAERIDRKLKEVREGFLDGLEKLEEQRGARKSKDIPAEHAFKMLVNPVCKF